MNFGEMALLTKRFEQIVNGSNELKEKRLNVLLQDIKGAYSERGLFNDMAAYWLYMAVEEEVRG